MKDLELHLTFAERARFRLRRCWQALARAFTTATRADADRLTSPTGVLAPDGTLAGYDASNQPVRPWTPARPGLNADASSRLTYPMGSSLRPGLRQEAASHMRHLR